MSHSLDMCVLAFLTHWVTWSTFPYKSKEMRAENDMARLYRQTPLKHLTLKNNEQKKMMKKKMMIISFQLLYGLEKKYGTKRKDAK